MSFENGTALRQACGSGLPRPETDPLLQWNMERLRKARAAFQSELEQHAVARPVSTERLVYLRAVAETFAKQIDALIGTMDRHAMRQREEAQELRLFFRVAAGCTAALLEAERPQA